MAFARIILIFLVFQVHCGLQKVFHRQNGLKDSSEESSRFCCSSSSKYLQDSASCPRFMGGSIPECPDGFIEATTSLCLFLTEKTKFPPKCPFPNNLPFESYSQKIEAYYNSSFWMPVQRNVINGLGYLYWIEPTTLYKTEVNATFYPYDVSNGYKNNYCLLYHNSNHIALVSCDEEHRGVCVYEKLNQISESLCSTSTVGLCRQSDFTSRTKCFCQGGAGQNQSEFIKAEFLEPYQNTVYRSITADLCTIGLVKQEEYFIWANSKRKLDYCYWDVETDFDNSFGAMKSTGWTLTETPLSCFLYETELELPEPHLELFYDKAKLELVITNPKSLKHISDEPLFFCFTNAGSYSLIYRYTTFERVKDDNNISVKYSEKPYFAGPGDYWCEAFKATSNEIVTSNVIFVNETSKFGAEFVVILNIQYPENTNPLTKEDLYQLLYGIFLAELKHKTSGADCSYSSRIMKVVDIDESKNKVLINLHFTCLLEFVEPQSFPQSSTGEEFEKIKNLINTTINELQETNMTMTDFRSATHCHAIEEDGLSWPMTKMGELARSKEFCFTEDGILVKRLCDGNFIDGAQWSEVTDCDVRPTESSITVEIINNWSQLSEADLMNFLYEISLRYEEFSNIDVFLIALILTEKFNEVEENEVVPIIDNLFKVSSEILEDSQKKMRATDILLEVIDKMKASNSTNFLTVPINLQKSSGIVIVKNEIKELPVQISWERLLISYNGLQAGIWLDVGPEAYDEEVVFKIFLNKAFFIDTKTKNFEYVFSVTVPETFTNSTIKLLHKLENDSRESFYWKHNLKAARGRGSWVQVTNITQNFPLYCLCNLQSDQSFAVAITTFFNSSVQNVTDDLEEILNSNDTAADIMDALSEISDRYSEFSANDVYLVSKILDKVSNVTDLNLEPLAHTVSNLHQIERYILAISQERNLATDGILHNIDTIIKNHNYSQMVNISKDNFMILIADVKTTNFSGIILYENKRIQTEILTGNVTIEEILEKDKLDSALIIPEDISGNDKVAVTIFSTDGLFNEKTTNPQFVSKIFGVTFSKNESFSKPLTFVYRVTAGSYDRSCSFWSYNKIGEEAGVWKKDNGGQSLSNFSQCDFEHTTHFALLLLDFLKYDNAFLEWITEINCSLSLFGLFGILLTAVFFERWRKNSGNQILLNYVLSNIVQILVFYLSSAIKEHLKNNLVCTIVGAVLHYAIISEFCWMFVIAVLQFKRFVEVLKGPPRHVLLKGCLCGWILPCLPVACSYFLDENTYTQSEVGLCYPSGLGLYLGIWLPICIIVTVNVIIFAYIIYSVVHKKTECSDIGNSDLMFQWRLAFLLFFMLGITWIFGFLSELDFGVIFGYVFCFSATLQGFVMFLFFIVFNANTRYLYKNALKRCCKKNY